MFIEPVFGKKFFGREEILATLHKRVTAIKGGYRQNLALTGPMLAGKSSILRHFLGSVRSSDIVPIYIEMNGEDFRSFSTRFMASLLYQYLVSEGRQPYPEFDRLREECAEALPVTLRQIDAICEALDRKKENGAYEKLLDITSIFKCETGKKCIVILDEFHNLANFNLKKPFQVFGKFIMVQKNTMYIVSSSQKTLLKEILSEKLSLLFGNFEVIDVDGFDNQTARSFISEEAKDAPVPDDITSYIIQLSQGNPFYLETILKRFSEKARSSGDQGRRDPKECLLDSLAELLYQSDGILNQYFTNTINFFLEKKARKTLINVLVSIARGNSQIKSMRRDMAKSDRALGEKLEKLKSMDLIDKNGVFYKIQDRLFEFWLRNVHSLKAETLVDDMDIKYLEFRDTVDRDFLEFCQFNSLGAEATVRMLFSSFRNERVCLNMNDRKMPLFGDVDSRRLSGNVSEIAGVVDNSSWVCHVKEGDIMEENDILCLSGQKNIQRGTKIVRKIAVPLGGIEHTAFLLAKENNIWVWDIKKLNRMLRLYGKFELVL